VTLEKCNHWLHKKTELEAKHRGQFVAIEPISEEYFLGDQFIDAASRCHSARFNAARGRTLIPNSVSARTGTQIAKVWPSSSPRRIRARSGCPSVTSGEA
jgi:hypothetical protein